MIYSHPYSTISTTLSCLLRYRNAEDEVLFWGVWPRIWGMQERTPTQIFLKQQQDATKQAQAIIQMDHIIATYHYWQ